MDNKNREAGFVLVVGIVLVLFTQGDQIRESGVINDALKSVGQKISSIRPSKEEASEEAVSPTEVIDPLAPKLPAFAMVNTTSAVREPGSEKLLGKIKQGTVVEVQKRKENEYLIQLNGAEGFIPLDNLTFRK